MIAYSIVEADEESGRLALMSLAAAEQVRPHHKTTPLQSSEEALLPWTTCSSLAARAFLGIGASQPNLYPFSIH
jgi:hypothetical protein